ncbi:hypothetical protein BDV27DRAFT_5789 [Aspergillus caelatus]|uniref:Uncharacterized protein n=1 Tax=Aspergillus caelatus TaxID=61420 RepID=A0A5N7AJX4_9EURO|nr:uncharacterized protein BDV27DRAFT_5789 [Aspergillus caelatus]KAE8369496.1 hypothetical protein BDV27DRAFT_5789 [Aspergillus caelatus]
MPPFVFVSFSFTYSLLPHCYGYSTTYLFKSVWNFFFLSSPSSPIFQSTNYRPFIVQVLFYRTRVFCRFSNTRRFRFPPNILHRRWTAHRIGRDLPSREPVPISALGNYTRGSPPIL